MLVVGTATECAVVGIATDVDFWVDPTTVVASSTKATATTREDAIAGTAVDVDDRCIKADGGNEACCLVIGFTTVASSTTTVAGWTVLAEVHGIGDDDNDVADRLDIPNQRGNVNVGLTTTALVGDLDDVFLEATVWLLFEACLTGG